MTADREQTRRDAEQRQYVCQCAKDCLALLAELEQAEALVESVEQDRDAWQARAEQAERERDEAKRRLKISDEDEEVLVQRRATEPLHERKP